MPHHNLPTFRPVFVDGIPPDVPERVAAIAHGRLADIFSDIAAHSRMPDPLLKISGRPLGSPEPHGASEGEDETLEQRAQLYRAEPAKYGFEQLVLPADQAAALLTAIEAIRLRARIFDEWGLRAIEPAPSTALNLHGPPGTGKTLAAHAIASRLGMPIIMAGYAELESKFHGDGPKNVKAAFLAAQSQQALLFVDEADSLLSRRLTEVNQGSEQAINSMRSQIILCLDAFSGVVVFSTNLVANYDRAFESRVRHFHFSLPDADARTAIWRKLLVPSLPLAPHVAAQNLSAATEGFSGREIKLAVLGAAEYAAVRQRNALDVGDFQCAIAQIRAAHDQLRSESPRQATPGEQVMIESDLRARGIIGDPPSDTPAP